MCSNTKQGLAPLVAVIIILIVIGGGGYTIKKIADKRQEKKVQEEQTTAAEKEKMENEENEKRAEANIGRAIHIKLDEQNKSGQKGEATITQTGTSTVKVIVSITGKPSGVAQPAHIHLGSCPNPGVVKYPLTDVTKGASQAEIPITLDQLLSELPLAINVHKSAAEIKVYTSCGNIEAKEVMTGGEMQNMKGKMDNGKKEEKGKKDEKKTDSSQGAAVITAIPTETTVTYSADGFSPKSVTVKKGDTVVFVNKTDKKMSVASNVHPTHLLYPEFDQYKTTERGKDEFHFTFEKVGTWGYHDHLNASMGGTVVVTE